MTCAVLLWTTSANPPWLVLWARALLISALAVRTSCLSSLHPARLQIEANPSQSVLTLAGEDVRELEKAAQHVAYLNSRQFPTPGIRRLKLSSTVRYPPTLHRNCFGSLILEKETCVRRCLDDPPPFCKERWLSLITSRSER